MNWLSMIFGPVIDLGKGVAERFQVRRQRKDEIDGEIHKLNIKGIQDRAAATENWELENVKSQGGTWKDEFVTLQVWFIFDVLFLAAIFGNTAMMDRVLLAFEYMAKTPDWFQWVFVAVTLAAVGIKVWKSRKE